MNVKLHWPRKKQLIPEPVSQEELDEVRRRQEIIQKKLDTYRKGKGKQQWTTNS